VSIWLWKVLDNRVVEACLGHSLALGALITVAVLMPDGSGFEAAAWFFAFFKGLALIWELITALIRLDGARQEARVRPRP